MKYNATFCDPFSPDIIQLPDIAQEQIITEFEKINWRDYLQKMSNVPQKEIHYSPSFEVYNPVNKTGLIISAVGEPDKYEFYIFYKRPKTVKLLFGLIKKSNEEYTSDTTGQTKQDAIDCLNALIKNDDAYLANKIGQ